MPTLIELEFAVQGATTYLQLCDVKNQALEAVVNFQISEEAFYIVYS